MAQCPPIDSNGWLEFSLLSAGTLRLWERRRGSYRVDIPDSTGDFTELTCLDIDEFKLLWLPNTVERLHNLVRLDFLNCGFEEMPANLGQLASLQHLSLSGCTKIKSLPISVAALSKLKFLDVRDCKSLTELPPDLGQLKSLIGLTLKNCGRITELPASLGQLESLTLFELQDCNGIKSLPNSMENLYQLDTLSICGCKSVVELPVNLNVLTLGLKECYIRFLPNINLQTLSVTLIHHSFDFLYVKPGLRSLQRLVLKDYSKIPTNLHELRGLLLLDISSSMINWLPWSITQLRELQFLFLPTNFRLETLPLNLKDSLIVSVMNKHVRRTWKQLKTEIPFPFPFPAVEYELALELEAAHSPWSKNPPGYLRMDEEIETYISNGSCASVWILDIKYGNIGHSVWMLPGLTHLYLYDCNFHYIPDTVRGPRHLSLKYCKNESLSESLSKLSNLETLELIHTDLPADMDMLVNLKRLSLRRFKIESLPNGMKKLPNLDTLELDGYVGVNSLPKELNLAKLKLINSTLKSFPTGLLHLEILHPKAGFAHVGDHSLVECSNQLVDLKTLSITCRELEFLPSIAELHNLRELQLKDCFSLKELPSDLDKLVKLCTLDISGTRIKSLPDSITKLHKLQQVILPKCFRQGSLPKNLEKVSIIDDTNEVYYEHEGYYSFRYRTLTTCNEGDGIVPDSIPGVDNVVAQKTIEEGVIAQNPAEVDDAVPEESEQNAPTEITNISLPNAPNDMDCYDQTLEEGAIAHNPAGKEDHAATCGDDLAVKSYSNLQKQNKEVTQEVIQPFLSKSLRQVDAAKELEAETGGEGNDIALASTPEVDKAVLEEPERNAITEITSAYRQPNSPLLDSPDTIRFDNYVQMLESAIAQKPADSILEVDKAQSAEPEQNVIAKKMPADRQSNLFQPNAPDAVIVDYDVETLESVNAQNPAEVNEAFSEEPEQNFIAKEIPAHTQLNPPLPNAPDTKIVDYCDQPLEEGVTAQNRAGNDHAATCVDDSSVESDANLHEANSSTENIHNDLPDRQVVTINSEHEHGDTPRASENELNNNHQSCNEKGKIKRKDITLEMIQQ